MGDRHFRIKRSVCRVQKMSSQMQINVGDESIRLNTKITVMDCRGNAVFQAASVFQYAIVRMGNTATSMAGMDFCMVLAGSEKRESGQHAEILQPEKPEGHPVSFQDSRIFSFQACAAPMPVLRKMSNGAPCGIYSAFPVNLMNPAGIPF